MTMIARAIVAPSCALLLLLWLRACDVVRWRTKRTNTCSRPLLAPRVHVRFDERSGEHQLVGPEARLVLNGPGAAIARLCDGRTLEELCAALGEKYVAVDAREVAAFVRIL